MPSILNLIPLVRKGEKYHDGSFQVPADVSGPSSERPLLSCSSEFPDISHQWRVVTFADDSVPCRHFRISFE